MTKITIFFNQFQQGWTEVWYSNASLPTAISSLDQSILSSAVSWRGIGVAVVGIRYSTVGARNSITFKTANSYQSPGGWVPANPEDVTAACAVWVVRTSANQRKRMFLRGLADTDVQRDADGSPIVGAALYKGVQQYLNNVQAANWGFRYQQNPTNTPGLLQRSITSITGLPGSLTQVQFGVAAPEMIVGAQVRFGQVSQNTLPGFPRFATIQAVGATGGNTWINIPYLFRGAAAVSPPKAYGILNIYNLAVIANSSFDSFSTHKTGRPIFLLRGRRAAGVKAL